MIEDSLLYWNPWWNKDRSRLDGLKERSAQKEALPLFKRKEVLTITGVRRCGKTALMHLFIRDLLRSIDEKQILYVNLDDPSLEGAGLQKIYDAYREMLLPGNKQYIFLDEVQNIDGWERWVKKMYDGSPNVKITVSGSNASLLKAEFSSLLTERSLTFEVFPLSFEEFLQFKGTKFENEIALRANKPEIKHRLEEYLKTGGFPESALSQDPEAGHSLMVEYFNAILARDVLTRFEIKERKKLEKLAYYLMTNISNPIPSSSASKTLDLNVRTVDEYMGYLEDVYLFFFLPNFSYSLNAQYMNPRKVYCIDPGLRSAVSFRFSEDVGRLLENVVYLVLRRTSEVYYWKGAKCEVDFVIKKGLKVTDIIQVCYSPEGKTKEREERGLIKAAHEFKLKKGTVVTWEMEETNETEGVTIEYVPAWRWLLG